MNRGRVRGATRRAIRTHGPHHESCSERLHVALLVRVHARGTLTAQRRRMNSTHLRTTFVCTLACVSFSSLALAEEPAQRREANDNPGVAVAPNSPVGRFGLKSELAISSDAGFSISNTSLSGHSGSSTKLELRPAIDYFVINDLSVGGFIGLDYTHVSGGHTTTFSIGPRVGYNFSLSDRFSVWPKAGLSYSTTSGSSGNTQDVIVGNDVVQTTSSGSSSGLALNLFVPFMFHPVEHFFIGFGPALDVDLTGDVKATTIAGRLTIGGWI
jgi:hypothetical protein